MTVNDQLDRWRNGESIHNKERDECCPDFSCCKPELLADRFEREKFYEAWSEGEDARPLIDSMLLMFLSRMLKQAGNDR